MPTVVHVSEFVIPECNFLGSTCKLRRFYDSDWTDVDGVFHPQGSVSDSDFFNDIDCTLIDHAAHVPAFDETPTVTALINPAVRRIWQFVDQSGRARKIITGDSGWFIPASPTSTTRAALDIVNQGQSLLWPINTYLNSAGVQALIDVALGIARYATSVIAGWVRLSKPADNSSDPIAVGANDYARVGHNGIGSLDVPPDDPSLPVFVGANSPRVAQSSGSANLTDGLATVSDAAVTDTSLILVFSMDENVSGNPKALTSGIVPGISFEILSDPGDNGLVGYVIFGP